MVLNTPLLKINYQYKNEIKSVYAKLEYLNISGSIKDRIVYFHLDKLLKNKQLKGPLVEATSGNTGIALASYGARHKLPVVIYMPNWVSDERRQLLKQYGATVYLVSKEEGGFKTCVKKAKQYALTHHGYYFNQFANEDNVLCHKITTAKEVIQKISVDGFVCGIGTGGTFTGIAKALKEVNPKVHLYALEPTNMSLIKNGTNGFHQIEGIGDEFIPEIVDLNLIEDILLISDEEALEMSQKLARELGLGVGISSGANLLAAIKMHDKIDGNILTVLPDDNKKYMTTNLFKDEYDDLDINLLSYEIVGEDEDEII